MPQHALIIEDEILLALEIELLLAELGFASFDWADSPRMAVACAQRTRPDLVTADLRIHGGTGLEAVKAIRAELGHVPVVYVTGNPDMLRDEPNAIVVPKPIQLPRLKAAIDAADAAA